MSESFSSAIEKMARYIVNHYDGSIDHACGKCCSGEMVIPDYECGYHLAKRIEEAQRVIQPDNAQ